VAQCRQDREPSGRWTAGNIQVCILGNMDSDALRACVRRISLHAEAGRNTSNVSKRGFIRRSSFVVCVLLLRNLGGGGPRRAVIAARWLASLSSFDSLS